MPTDELPLCLGAHRVKTSKETTAAMRSVCQGRVRWEPVRSLWFTGMALGAIVGGALTFSWAAFAVFVAATVLVLLLGHSLGMHRKLVHDSFDCPRWLEYLLVWLGTQVGDLIVDARRWGLDMVMGCFLLAMVLGGHKSLRMLMIWIVAAGSSLLAYWYLPENSHVVVGALAGGILGVVWMENKHER